MKLEIYSSQNYFILKYLHTIRETHISQNRYVSIHRDFSHWKQNINSQISINS
jgi:hypothetical protein